MAFTGMSDDFDLDDHGILRDSMASADLFIDDDGILRDDIDIFKHAASSTAGHGTDSGFGGDKQSSTSTLQHLHASFDDDLAPIGDESINISDFEASRDDLSSIDGEADQTANKRSKSYQRSRNRELETPGSTLERPLDVQNEGASSSKRSRQKVPQDEQEGDQDLFSEEYYQQLRELGVLVDGADFSRDESLNDFEALESHVSREHVDYDDDNRDLIGEYLQDDSAPTISGQSFPEISPEDAALMYSESQQTGDDDEIFLINRHLLPASSHLQAQKLPTTPSFQGSRPSSRGSMPGSRSQTPRSTDGRPVGGRRQMPRSKSDRRSPSPANSRSATPLDRDEYMTTRSETNTPYRGRPDSAASHASVTSETASGHPNSSHSKSSMAKARSQESFFEHDKPQNKSGEKVPKRLLPTPSTPELNHSFKVKNKSKSVSNIANKSGPVKPTHMSISEITRLTMDETGDGEGGAPVVDGALNKSEGELSTQLKQESVRRKQATELVQQLQKEYDSLLSKYALAELTIDQMRLGARITIHADSPTPSSVQSGMISPGAGAHKPQVMQLAPTPAQQAVVGRFSPLPGDGQSLAADPRSQPVSRAEKSVSVSSIGTDGAAGGVVGESEDRSSTKAPRPAETVKLTLQSQAKSLDDRLDQFHTLMEQRQLTLEEQEKAFENIRTDHEKLRRTYLQAKEDYNVLRRSGASLPDADFDGNKELEGQLFRLGMKFDEVHEKVDSNLKEKTTRRQPFQTSRLMDDEEEEDRVEQENGQTSDQYRELGGSDMVDAAGDPAFDKRAEHLHDEYMALMDRYRRLQQMGQTTDRDKETDNLVRKMKDICNEMPDMFRLPPELQERYERLQRREQDARQRRSPLPADRAHGEGAVGGGNAGERMGPLAVPPSPKSRGTPLVGDHSISPYLSGHRGSRDSRMDDSLRRTPSSLSGSRSSLTSPRDHNSSTAALRSSATPSPQDRDQSRDRLSPSSLDGAAAPRDRDSYDPRMPRPNRHRHDFRDPKLSKMPDRGSFSSLPDSGISDQETRDRRHDDALANLPTGKFKQMTRQRGADDADSGFIGSMVGSEVSQNQSRDRQPEGPLRLRERPPGDRSQNRARHDSSGSTSTAASSTRRDSESDRRSRQPRAAKQTATTSTATGRNSIDRSYDGELDESTVSDAGARDLRLKQPAGGARPKEQQQERRRVKTPSVGSRSTQDDETLEDLSDGAASDVSTPRHVDPVVKSHNREESVHQESQSTPHTPTTANRPPTPFREEPSDGEEELTEERERGAGRQEVKSAETGRARSRRSSDDGVVQKSAQQQQQLRPRSPPPPSPQKQQRPQSRGEPTTDLYHTRPRRERERSRERSGERTGYTSESSRTSSRLGRRGSEGSRHRKGEDIGVGSDIDVQSDATHGSSVNSARLRALQDEIEKLKEGVKQAHDKASERRTPPQQPPPPQQEGPEYYDPFDDPYGFMRMPRRRANSFSGGRVRDWDEWYWTLPNDRRNDDGDIPLGYAAADAYSSRQRRDKTPEAARHRLRRRMERRRHGAETLPKPVDGGDMVNGGEAEAMYDYYLPTRQGVYAQQGFLAQPQAANLNPYRQHTTPLSASQPNLAGRLAGVQPSSYQYQQPSTQQASGKQPWYQIRRAQWPAASTQYTPTRGYHARTAYQQPATSQSPVYYSSGYPSSGSATPVQGAVGQSYRTESCPLCGGTGAHIHEDDVEPVHGYGANDFATNARYLVREFGESGSDDSDLDIRRGRRSRSLSRSRGHSETRSSSRRRGRRYRRNRDADLDSDDDVDLNESLVLSEDINRLTKRMIGTVRGELSCAKDKREFGSSYW
ncbi:hypothetical protein BaRGS_00011729 [Batillaria attramentaria]|uniref:AKNA n=1 Tax=Batillaria attramentaria TaxID=370345 RepID=A0ABD0LCG4_9CAEN